LWENFFQEIESQNNLIKMLLAEPEEYRDAMKYKVLPFYLDQ